VSVELKARVIDRLRTVIDPETGADVVRMRLIQGLKVDDEGVVHYVFRPSSPLCPLAVTLALQIKQAVASVPGVSGQEISVTGYIDAAGLTELLTQTRAEGQEDHGD
jgi:metal-sulfur cluster biosynthetic enzyme